MVVHVEFKEAGTKAQPTTTLDTGAAVAEQADLALDASVGSFESGFDTAGPGFLGDDVVELMTGLTDDMNALSARLASVGRPLAMYQRSAMALANGARSLIATPATLAGNLRGLIANLLSLSRTSRSRYSTAQSVASLPSTWSPVATTTTVSRTRQSANRESLAALVRQLAVIEAARSSADIDFATYDEAVATRNTLSNALNGEIRTTRNDALKTRLRLLNAAMVRDINLRGADLTKLSEITPATTLPALVVAHQILGDATRAKEILSRNPSIKDPLAVPGGRALKVLAS